MHTNACVLPLVVSHTCERVWQVLMLLQSSGHGGPLTMTLLHGLWLAVLLCTLIAAVVSIGVRTVRVCAYLCVRDGVCVRPCPRRGWCGRCCTRP